MIPRPHRFLLSLLLFSVLHPAAAQTTAAPVFNPANGHWYQLVRTSGMTWSEARTAAQAMFFAGYRGHLATVTLAAENQFVSAYLTANPPSNTV